MPRLIDADALDDVIQILNEKNWGITRADYKMIDAVIFEFPTIEERKKGKWIWDGESRREYPYKCSECGEIDYYAFLYDAETRTYKQQDKFCPNCGAKMEGE